MRCCLFILLLLGLTVSSVSALKKRRLKKDEKDKDKKEDKKKDKDKHDNGSDTSSLSLFGSRSSGGLPTLSKVGSSTMMMRAPGHSIPLSACQGECFLDTDCAPGLLCFHRSGNEQVPGCSTEGGEFGTNYCFNVHSMPEYRQQQQANAAAFDKQDSDSGGLARPSIGRFGSRGGAIGTYRRTGNYTYQPGHWTVHQHGLLLSQGLLARVIATQGELVRYDNSGTFSSTSFHYDPDGAAIFSRPETPGYVYVSNSEKTAGGVGALYFNKEGQVMDYKMILTGTTQNCGGGKTWWNTWLTCEEDETGQVWEVDPWGARSQLTIVSPMRAKYESAAYDNRNVHNPKFFVSIDDDDGPLLRFTPATSAVHHSLVSGNYNTLLNTNDSNDAAWDYLVLSYNNDEHDDDDGQIKNNRLRGTFRWGSLDDGRASASSHFRGLEGVDVYDGMLYMTAKKDKRLFVLDLDLMTFEETSTQSGAFDAQPDQIVRLLHKNDKDSGESSGGSSILYFCEDGDDGSGIHGRDANGNFFSILQQDMDQDTNGGVEMLGETTGLAMSPDNMRMYVSYQSMGKLLELRRTDGLPFSGRRLDIKYHQDVDKDNVFS